MVAEGVEDEESWRRLVELGCDLAQGYHVARALPPEGVEALMAARGDLLALSLTATDGPLPAVAARLEKAADLTVVADDLAQMVSRC